MLRFRTEENRRRAKGAAHTELLLSADSDPRENKKERKFLLPGVLAPDFIP